MTAIEQLSCIAKSNPLIKESRKTRNSIPISKKKPNQLASTWPFVDLVYFAKLLKKERGELLDPQVVYSIYVEMAVLEFENDNLKLELLKAEIETYICRQPSNVERLTMWIKAINTKICRINQIYPSLVKCLLKINWFELNQEYGKAFQKSLGYILSSGKEGFEFVMEYLTSFFTSKILLTPNGMIKLGEILHGLIHFSPSFIEALVKKIDQKYPHISRENAEIILYTKCILKLIDHFPSIKHQILQTILKKAVHLDCEIMLDEILPENTSYLQSTIKRKQFHMEDDEENELAAILSEESGMNSDPEEHDLGEFSDHDSQTVNEDAGYDYDYERTKDLDALSDHEDTIVEVDGQIPKVEYNQVSLLNKLDLMMQSLFKYLFQKCSFKERESNLCFLLKEFKNHYFSKTGMKHVQYLLFYYCSLEGRYCNSMLTLFFKGSITITADTILSAQYSLYFSSFISRAKYISSPTVYKWSKLVLSWLTKFVKKIKPSSYKNSYSENSIFYSMTQGFMYIFCFRWRDLVDVEATRASKFKKICFYENLTSFKKVLECSMAPLKVCPANIVTMFMKVNKATKFLMIDLPKINSSKALCKKPKYLEALKGYFPFEPFTLSGTRSYIDTIYINFKEIDSDSIRDFSRELKRRYPDAPNVSIDNHPQPKDSKKPKLV